MNNIKHLNLYMRIAEEVSKMSSAVRLKVGSIIVKNDNIIGFGWNGTPSGWDNNCENIEYTYDERDTVNGNWNYDSDTKRWSRLKTKPEVIHSESNAILKVAKSTESTNAATMFCTHAPCLECAKLIYQCGISKLFYREQYRSDDGINFLTKSNVEVVQYKS